jgi:hypothetical protein
MVEQAWQGVMAGRFLFSIGYRLAATPVHERRGMSLTATREKITGL